MVFKSSQKLLQKANFLRFVALMIVAVTVKSNSRGQDRISLDSAVSIAINNNLQIKEARLNEQLAEQSLKLSKFALYPSLTANSSLNHSYGRNEDPFSSEFFNQRISSGSGSLNTNIPILHFAQKLKEISENKYLLEASRSNTDRIKYDITLNVVSNYLEILYYEDLLRASNLQLISAKELLEQDKKQFDYGNKTVVDLSEGRARVALAELNVSNSTNELELAYQRLGQLMERDLQTKFQVIKIVFKDESLPLESDYTEADLIAKALKNHPGLKAAEYRTLAAAKNIEVVRSALLPRLSIQAGVSTGYSSMRQRAILSGNGLVSQTSASFVYQLRDNLNQYIGINLSMPIFNGLSSKIALTRAKLNHESFLISQASEKSNLYRTINQSILELKAARAKYKSTKKTFEATSTALEATKHRYKVGLVNSTILTQAQLSLNLLEFELIKAKYDLVFKRKIINFYTGEPITSD